MCAVNDHILNDEQNSITNRDECKNGFQHYRIGMTAQIRGQSRPKDTAQSGKSGDVPRYPAEQKLMDQGQVNGVDGKQNHPQPNAHGHIHPVNQHQQRGDEFTFADGNPAGDESADEGDDEQRNRRVRGNLLARGLFYGPAGKDNGQDAQQNRNGAEKQFYQQGAGMDYQRADCASN